jgi:hypothetical protein
MPESISLNLNLDLSLLRSLRPCLGQGASWRAEGWAGKKVAFFASEEFPLFVIRLRVG